MNRLKLPVILPLTVALLGVAGYAYYRVQVQQAATLARITALDTCLAASNQRRARAANNIVAALSEEVRKNHNMAADVAVLRQTQAIQAHTKNLVDTLQWLRRSWPASGRDAELKQLTAQAERYATFIRGFMPETLPLTQPFPRLAATGWLGEFAMTAEPKPAALALLTKLETQVRQIEAEALMNQATKVVFEGVFEKIGAFVAPTSQTVTPGSVYQAQLLLALTTSTSQAQFSANGHELPIAPDFRHAAVQFKIPAARPGQPDTVRVAWHGRIRLPWADGDTVLETIVPYLIVKPRPR